MQFDHGEWVDIKTLTDIYEVSESAIQKAIKRGRYVTARRVPAIQSDGKAKGRGGKIWQISVSDPAIPDKIREKLLDQLLTLPVSSELAPAINLPVAESATTLPHINNLNGNQQRVMDARTYLMRLIQNRASGKKVMQAIREIVATINSGDDSIQIVRMAACANDRKGIERGMSVATLSRWWSKWLQNSRSVTVLAPVKSDRLPYQELSAWIRGYVPGSALHTTLPLCIPPWLPYFLDEYRRPQKPAMQQSLIKLCKNLPPEIEPPSYDQLRRLIKKVPLIYLEKGRKTGAEYNSLTGYVERDASVYDPMTICQIDGHSFKAYVAHPSTGAHFHPEVCGVIDLTTRALVGWSAGLAESSITVGDAFRHTCTVNSKKPWGGIPAMLEADRGAGNMAGVNSDEFIGLFARIGTTFEPPARGGNPQGHGAVERSNQSIWIKAAKELPTYTGKDMDRGIRKKVYQRLERDLKQVTKAGKLGLVAKTSELLLSWSEFLEALERWSVEYNNTPHRSLPKITAPLPHTPDGKAVNRHMTPFECWADYVGRGFKPVNPDDTLLNKLFMPHETVTVKREKLTLHGNAYHSCDLDEYHNSEVIVAYDIHNPHSVTVLDLAENYICQAQWNGNRAYARPISKVEKATMQRQNRRVKLKELQIDLINSEAQRDAIEIKPLTIELDAAVLEFESREEQKRIEKAAAPRIFNSAIELKEDIRERQKEGLASGYEIRWADDWDRSFGGDKVCYIGLYKDDPYCAGRFNEENVQPEIESK